MRESEGGPTFRIRPWGVWEEPSSALQLAWRRLAVWREARRRFRGS